MPTIKQGKVETARSKQVHFENCNRIKNPIQNQTPPVISVTLPTAKIFNKNIPGNDPSNKTAEEPKDLRDPTYHKPQLYFKDVSGPKGGWWGSTHFRSAGSESTYLDQKVQTGVSRNSARIFATSGLHDQNRSVTGLFPCSNFEFSQKIPQDSVQWRIATANRFALWTLFSASNLCSSFELDCGSPTSKRLSSPSISGRLPVGESEPVRVKGTGRGGCHSSGTSGLEHKLLKVSSRTISKSRILGSVLEHPQQQKITTRSKGGKDPRQAGSTREARHMLSPGSTDPSRPFELCQHSRSQGPTALQKDADLSQTVLPKQTTTKKDNSSRGSDRDAMVEESSSLCVSASTQRERNSFLDHRRSGCGMGSPVKRASPVRNVEQESKVMAFEPEGDVCGLCCNKESDGPPRRCSHISPDRQSHPRCLYQEGGGHEVLAATEPDIQTAVVDRPAESVTVGLLPPGEVQRHRRQAIPRKASSRMAFAPRGLGGHIPKLGSAGSRLVRIGRNKGSTKVRNTRLKGLFSRILQCVQSSLEVPPRMDLSSSQLNTASLASSERSLGHIHINCADVDSVLLDAGSSGTSTRETPTNTRPAEGSGRQDHGISSSPSRTPGTTSLESWGWSKQIAEWNTQEKELLRKSWRSSTLTTYAPAIKRWTEWCTKNSVDCRSPSGHDVARFLANLHLTHDLAYNTILLHKSAIATYCANSEMLSKNFLVKQILKSISSAKPISQKPPIWDTKILYDWLLSTANKNTLFDAARRTAIILLLASGRRIHDLTLLRISKESLIESDDNITLWPSFGSKTDSSTRRQSGWCLTAHSEERICPVKHIKLLITLSEPRRSTSQKLNDLFISVTGTVKPASKANIAGWIRSIFKEAGIDAPPGSVRSAVASKGWLDNRPIDEILERGNWKCFMTFKNHYYRSVQMTENNFSTDMLHDHFTSA